MTESFSASASLADFQNDETATGEAIGRPEVQVESPPGDAPVTRSQLLGSAAQAQASNTAPSLNLSEQVFVFDEIDVNVTPALIAADASFTDPDDNFDGGALTVSGVMPEDRIAARHQGDGAGEIGVLDGTLRYGGVEIGTISGGEGGTLTISFNANATSEAVQALIRNLTYANVSDTPYPTRTLKIEVFDADGAVMVGGPASFQSAWTSMPYAVPDEAQNIFNPAFADLNNDGLLDMIAGTAYGRIDTWFRNADGTLTKQLAAANPFDSIDVNSMASPAFVDMNADGRLDLVVAGAFGTGFRVFHNNGDGSFTEQTGADNPFSGLSTGPEPDIAFTDVDGDGDMDMVTTTLTGFRYYRNDNGAFTRQTGSDDPFTALGLESPNGLTFLDADGDGKLDLVVRVGETLQVARANGDGSYTLLTGAQNPLTGFGGGLVHRPQAVDYDGDGDLDLIYGITWGGLYAFRNDAPSGAEIQVNVAPSNDSPITADASAALDEDSAYQFSAADFAFSDADGHTLSGVVIVSVPGAGSLTFNGAEVHAGDFIAIADIGGLVFTPGADGNGEGYAGFTFRVADSGDVFRDRHLSEVHSFTFDVNAVNDAPVFGLPPVTVERLTTYTDVYPGYTVQNMSADGNLVLVTSSRQLEPGDTDAAQDLYLLDRSTGEFTRLLSPDGSSLSGYRPVISADGNKVAFMSWDATLVPDDTNGQVDFFVYDRVANTLVRVNTAQDGREATGSSMYDDIIFSPDGTMVLFSTRQEGLANNDWNNNTDIFVKVLATGEIHRVSVDLNGNGTTYGASFPFFSPDGTRIGFVSYGALLDDDTNGTYDIYIRDITTLELTRVSVGPNGEALPLEDYRSIQFSPDGATLLFESYSEGAIRIYTLNLTSGELSLVSASADGGAANYGSGSPRFLPDGIHVVFTSGANNLVPGVSIPPYSSQMYLKNTLTGEISLLTVDANGNAMDHGWNFVGFANGGAQMIVGSQYGVIPGDPEYGTGELYLVTINGLPARFADGQAPVLIAPGVTISDIDSADFADGLFTIAITGNGEADDRLSIATSAVPGTGIEIDDGSVLFDSFFVGVLEVVDGVLVVHLTPGATAEALTALARAIQFESVSATPSQAPRTITFTLDDGDGGNATFTSQVQVVDANNAPTSADTIVSMVEDAAYTFTIADFAFGDGEGDAMAGVEIVSLPNGLVTLDGNAVQAGQFVAAADLDRLSYLPAKDGYGAAYSTLTFKVRDTGGTADGGVNLSATHTITFDVTGVNDDPVFGVESSFTAISPGTALYGGEFNYGGVSADGNLVTFVSDRQLVADDTDDVRDIYILNRATGEVTRIVSGSGGDGDLYETRISPDGTKIAFLSDHSHLVDGDTNGLVDLFVVDVATGVITRVSEGGDGSQGTAFGTGWFDFAFSPDSNSIAFSVQYGGMVPGDDSTEYDVFIKDLTSGALERVTVEPEGEVIRPSYAPFFSPDGTMLGFLSRSRLSPDDAGAYDLDLYVRDLETGEFTRIAMPGGGTADGYYDMAFSPDGTKILFSSDTDGLVPGDDNGSTDVFLLDLETGELTLVSAAADGAFSDGSSYGAKFTPDGNHVIFYNYSSTLIPGEGLEYPIDGLLMKNLLTGEVTRLSVNADGTPSDRFWNVIGVTDKGVMITSDSPLTPDADDDGTYVVYELLTGGNVAAYRDGQGPVTIAPAMTVSDVDGVDFDGGMLTVRITANDEADDALLVLQSTTPGTGFELIGTDVFFDGNLIGGYENQPGGIVFTFNGLVTAATVQALVQAIQFANMSGTPSEATRGITFTLTDGDGGSTSIVRQVTVTEISDAPDSIGGSAAFDEGDSHVFTLADFNFHDADGDALTEILIDTLPGSGTLLLDGVAVTEGQAISAADIIAGKLVYVSSGWGSIDFTFRLRDDGGTADGGSDLSAPVTFIFDIARVNDNPVLRLHYETGTDTAVTVQEGGFIPIAPTADIEDDTIFFANGTLTVSVADATADDVVRIVANSRVTISDNVVSVSGVAVGTWTGGIGGALVITFNADASQNAVERVLQAIQYGTLSQTPPETRTITVVVTDGEGGTSATGTATVTINAVDNNPVAQDDIATVAENDTVVIDIFANETDVDGGAAPVLTSINGMYYVPVGFTHTLESGATVTINEDGTITYNPNGAYNWLISQGAATAAGGATNTSAVDRFYYTLIDGSRGYVDVTVTGVDGAGDRLVGSAGDDVITGLATRNYFDLSDGGADTATGGAANDGFYMGGELDANDRLDGGGGADNQLGLQGDTMVVLHEDTLKNIQTMVLLSGNGFDGMPGASYDITMADGNVAAGQRMTINANLLLWNDSLRFDGSAETDGSFIVYAGQGDDVLIGGAKGDAFFFGNDGRFDGNDRIDGGAGEDQLGLRGDYSWGVEFQADTMKNIESLVLMSAYDTRYGQEGNGGFAYDLKLHDANLGAGQLLVVNGNMLRADEWMKIDGSDEADGHFRFIGGAGDDQFIGGAGDDEFYGRLGADVLTGGEGDDIFFYRSVQDSTLTSRDHITDFTAGDRIDLSAIDANLNHAGKDAFSFIGDAEFSSAAGELRVFQSNGSWFVEADVDGDGVADLSIEVTTPDAHPLGITDFIL